MLVYHQHKRTVPLCSYAVRAGTSYTFLPKRYTSETTASSYSKSLVTKQTAGIPGLGTNLLHIYGGVYWNRRLTKTVNMPGKAGDVYMSDKTRECPPSLLERAFEGQRTSSSELRDVPTAGGKGLPCPNHPTIPPAASVWRWYLTTRTAPRKHSTPTSRRTSWNGSSFQRYSSRRRTTAASPYPTRTATRCLTKVKQPVHHRRRCHKCRKAVYLQ